MIDITTTGTISERAMLEEELAQNTHHGKKTLHYFWKGLLRFRTSICNKIIFLLIILKWCDIYK
jgi:hypothetical protein